MAEEIGCGMMWDVISIIYTSFVSIHRSHVDHLTQITIQQLLVKISQLGPSSSTSVQRNIHLLVMQLGSVKRMASGVELRQLANVSFKNQNQLLK